MWIPQTWKELLSGLEGAEEASSLDFKQQIDPKLHSLAGDVCAMTVDGGVLIYGVAEVQDDESERKRPGIAPIPLEGVREKIESVVSSSISQVPKIEVRYLPDPSDDSRGVVVVVVPRSAQAPHQVITNGTYKDKFLGRHGTQNIALSEGEVARLYQRRRQNELNLSKHLDTVIRESPYPKQEEDADQRHGELFAFVRPAFFGDRLFTASSFSETGSRGDLWSKMSAAALKEVTTPKTGLPTLVGGLNYMEQKMIDASTWRHGPRSLEGAPYPAHGAVMLTISDQGEARLFFGGAVEPAQGPAENYHRETAPRRVVDKAIALNLAQFFALLGCFYKHVGYTGQVDIGLRIDGLRSAKRMLAKDGDYSMIADGYGADEFSETWSVPQSELSDPKALAISLTQPLWDFLFAPGRNPLDPA